MTLYMIAKLRVYMHAQAIISTWLAVALEKKNTTDIQVQLNLPYPGSQMK